MGGNPVHKHAFPSMAGGTVDLVIGMFLCYYIVGRSTTEVITKKNGHRVRVVWLSERRRSPGAPRKARPYFKGSDLIQCL